MVKKKLPAERAILMSVLLVFVIKSKVTIRLGCDLNFDVVPDSLIVMKK
ncbi:MAG: hypothetical protein LBQ66_15045 [Planctomycetaceae bacterium]|jgi:hypothetical protein|nr:hypothetical protein [Planctomycetaceae bacterium]